MPARCGSPAIFARTSSTFNLRTESVDYQIITNNYTVNWFTGLPGGSGPTFQVVGLDFSNPANYHYRGFFEDYLTAKGEDWQGRLDSEYEPAGLDWLPKIQAGLRYVDRDADRTRRSPLLMPTPADLRHPDQRRAAGLSAVQLRVPRRQPQTVAAHLAGADIRTACGTI